MRKTKRTPWGEAVAWAIADLLSRPEDVDEWEGPWASEIALEESGLAETQIMKFRFDFGDDWRFRLLLERIEPSDGAADIQVIGSEGPSTKQSPTQE